MNLSACEPDLRQEHSLLLQFIYQCPVGLAELDNIGTVRLLNALGVALLFPLSEESGLANFFDLMRPHAPGLVELMEASSDPGAVVRDFRISFARSEVAVQLAFTAIRLDAGRLMVAFEDVTAVAAAERRTREALEAEAIQAGRVEMATSVLHDIGNAVTGIGTRSAQLLAEPPWPEIENLSRMSALLQSQAANLATVFGERKAAALGGLASALERTLRQREITLREHVRALASSVAHVQEILSIQRQYVHQRGAAQRTWTSLLDVLNDALAIHSASLEKRGIEVIRRFPSNPPSLKLDRTRMVQILGNLIRNACESFDSMQNIESVRRLELSAEILENNLMRLTCKDTGAGFPPDQAESFFKRGSTTKEKGSGIGLYSCRSTVDAHGGRIWMESDGPGKGATVTIDLPCGESEKQCA